MVTATSNEQATAKKTRERSQTAFPAFTLNDALAVPDVIHRKGGGIASPDHLAAYLGYKSRNNGSYLAKVSSAKQFGFIDERNGEYYLSARAKQILMPEFDDDRRQGLVDAFLAIPLFRAVYDDYKGGSLPEGLGLRNALRNKFHVIASRVDVAERTLMKSAEQAGFFDVRGSHTQLIIPPIGKPRPKEDPQEGALGERDLGAGGGGEGGDGGSGFELPNVKSKEDLQNAYIALLLNAFKAKLDKGEMDEQLGAKIEKLVGIEL